MEYANCQSKSLGNVPNNGRQCANELKLDWDIIDHCVRGPLVCHHTSAIVFGCTSIMVMVIG
jgi:hypothetical protein